MRKVRLLIAILFLILFQLQAQHLNFKHLSVKDGLVSNMVHTVLQDSDGFMWFGTEDGLSRYDGYTFLNFFQSPTDSLSLNNNLIISLAEDKKKQLWVGTHQGVDMLDLETYKVTRFNDAFKNVSTGFSVRTFFVDDDFLWIGTDNSGVFCLNIHTYQVKNYKHVDGDKSSLSANSINSIIKHSEKGLLIATSDGLDVLNPITSKCIHVLKGQNVSDLHLKSDGNVLLGTLSKHQYCLELTTDLVVKKLPIALVEQEKEVKVFSDSEENTWISVRDLGLVYTNNQTKESKQLLYDKNKNKGICSNTITNFFEDSFGNIWFSSFDAGLSVLDKREKGFIHIEDNHLPNGLLNNKVRAMYQDSDGDIWIGTKVDGTLSKFDKEAFTFQHYHSNANDPHSLSNDYVFSITENKPGSLWIGTLDGLNLFDKKTEKFEVWKHDENDPESLADNSVGVLLQNEDFLLVGTVTAGLDIYNAETNIFSHHKKTGAHDQISDDRVKVLYQDSFEQIWVGTMNGLNLFDKETRTFKQFLNNPEDSKSISENYILSIHEDKQRNLWIGTTLGVNLLDRKNQTFKVFTTKDGLAGNSVRGILEDEQGDLWLSTNNGLSKFNPSAQKFKNYNIYDGLQANEFSPFVFCKTAEGEMLFGGNQGFNMFDPFKIVDNPIVPKVLLTDFKILNQSVLVGDTSTLKKHITKTKAIELNYKQSVFSFEFVALNYTSSEKNEYAYKMVGFDKDWNYIGSKREATYTNLDSGTYVFRVKASNNDGFWNEEGLAVKVTILPPPWESWWAYAMYAVLLVLILGVLRQNAIKRSSQKKQRELNALKLKFFGNVSHEFRTPLTLILGPLEKMLKTEDGTRDQKQLLLMSRHAKRLLSLVNQLLDFQKIGSGELQVHRTLGDLVLFVKEIALSFVELSNHKKIHLEFQTEATFCETYFDKDKLEKVLYNLLSNAFKFTQEDGKVSVEMVVDTNSNKAILKVSDTGVGIPTNDLGKIFHRFYQVDYPELNSNQGSGIGLALTKEYVELLGGQISVESSVGTGSCFLVEIPLHTIEAINDKKEIVNIISAKEMEVASEDELILTKQVPSILLVEDSEDLRMFLKSNLSKKYRILEANNGEKALELALEHVPDIIVSDVMMPKMDGNELCSKVKTDERISHIPVVLLTAQVSSESQIEGFAHGADQYITKPFSLEVLESRIKGLLLQRTQLQNIFSRKIEVNPSEITITSIDEKLIQDALRFVEENMANAKYSVDQLSKSLGISRGHLYRKINSITGESPSGFIRSVRLKRAAQLLKSSSLNISEIAYQVGFTDPKYFSKCFKQEFSVLPSEFMSKYKK